VHTENCIIIDAPAARIYGLGARIEDWPKILPHYRRVRILRDAGTWRLAEMAATRTGIPVTWVSIQELDPARHVIRYRHVRGVTRGMAVEWTITPGPGGMLVRIAHDFAPPWPRPLGPLVARRVVGDLFVRHIAGRTLRQIKRAAEGTMPARPAGGAVVR
jgi:ribosome-associated toxin RatA of RatAB toxin-antitoxin module